MNYSRIIKEQAGFTILEVLIAAVLTGIITAASFSFYVRLHNQSEAQFELADTQNLCRVCLCDIKKNLRVAGYKLPAGHPLFDINGDTLAVYRNGSQPVDTIRYFLREFTSTEYNAVPNLDAGVTLSKLMKQINSGTAQIYADYITGIRFSQVDSTSIDITISAQTTKADMSRDNVNGDENQSSSWEYAVFEMDERVTVRN